MKQGKEKQTNPWHAMAVVGVVGTELATLLIIGVWLGRKVDSYFQTSPIFLIIGIFSGFVLGIWFVIRLIKPFIED
ncbi:hypothetical protein BHF71_01280 [Vulcanibacillus modesticaldus]|uniref:ATPase F0F1 n=1 Tax=Vulcanibacillus modesticaldus TaxID=337097 RepID=A0A1D2YW36_9BACI|nr:AtpZ/AtpI family protein [Vulcanibacillus modesticaldus]OEF99835.1 hypothetical protein BHF71_01280 [Vulcanibacillus modesticaldus]